MTHGLDTMARLNREAIHQHATKPSTAIELIADERARQIQIEGFSPSVDDYQRNGQLAKAAACYAIPPMSRHTVFCGFTSIFEMLWPFAMEWWKPTPMDRIRELTKAGALIVAEIERLQRISKQT